MQPHTLGYVQKVIRNMRPAGASFDRAQEVGVSTMEWGTWTAIETYLKRHNRVPDVVYDLRVKGSFHIFYHPETK